MGTGSGSPANQSHRLFEYANHIGESRHAAKQDGTARIKIFNRETKRGYAHNFTRVLVFAREHFGLRLAADLTPEMVAAFIQSLHQRGLASTTIAKYETVVNKADAIMRDCGWKPRTAPPLLPPEPKAPRERPDPLPYTSAEADQLLGWLARLREVRFGHMATLQRHAGLRIQEAVMLRAEAISESGDCVTLIRRDGQKSGRPRELRVFDAGAQRLLRELRASTLKRKRKRVFIDSDSEKKVKALMRAHQRALQWAATSLGIGHTKTHDLRRTYANEVLLKLQELGLDDKGAMGTLSGYLGHGESRMDKGLLGSYVALNRLGDFRPAGSPSTALD